MALQAKDLVYNPPSLELLSVCRIRQSISCLGENVERNLVKKLRTRDYDYLRNPNVPISLQDMCLGERRLVLESCLRFGSWGLLEMYILLTEDIVELDLDNVREQVSPKIDIKLDYKTHADLFLSLLIAKCPKLERLTLNRLNASHTALEKLCVAMTHITNLSLPCMYHTNKYDGVLRAIATKMPHLKYLDITNCTVEAHTIAYLLPTKDNALGGCPQLVYLDLSLVDNVDVKLLKKILLALPKLKYLNHKLLVNALGDLTEEEMGEDTGRSLNSLFVRPVCSSDSHLRYDNLAKSPAFERFNNNITTVEINVTLGEEAQRESASLSNVLKSLPNLRNISLFGISDTHENILPLLESIGNRVECLSLIYFSGNLSIRDIMRTCRNLVKLLLSLSNDNNIHHDQGQNPNQQPVLNHLTEINLNSLDTDMCTVDMLTALLKSPNLSKVTLVYIEAMSDDVMFKVLSSPGCTVIQLFVRECPLITAAPFVQWINREDCSLQHMRFYACEKVDCKSLTAAAEKCPKTLKIEEKYISNFN